MKNLRNGKSVLSLGLVGLVFVGLFMLNWSWPLKPRARVGEPEISFVDGVPMLTNVAPVVVVQGSDYEMGYQWYQQLVQIYGPWFFEIGLPDYSFASWPTREEREALTEFASYIEQYCPEMIDMFEGMADGATDAGVPLKYIQVLYHWVGDGRTISKVLEGLGSEGEDMCSGFAAWGDTTADGKTIASSSIDSGRGSEVVIVMFFPETGNNFLIAPFSPWGGWLGYRTLWSKLGGLGMNNKGLVCVRADMDVCCNPVDTWGYGIPDCIGTLHTLRFANDANEAYDMQVSMPSCDGLLGGFWVDAYGNNFVLESRPDSPIPAIRTAGDYGEDDFLYFTNNALCVELLECEDSVSGVHEWTEQHSPQGGLWDPATGSGFSSVTRNLELYNLLHNYYGWVDLDFVKMMWRFKGEPGAWGERRQIFSSGNQHISIAQPDDGDNGLYYSCTRYATRGLNSRGVYLVEPTRAFYQLKLDSSPAKVASAAGSQARNVLFLLDNALSELTYWDVPYAPVDEMFNEAATEWWKGYYHEGLAKKTTGNEAIYNFGKAIRCYTRCQAIAQKGYNALFPPPTSPEDLGLPEYYGAWGEWVTP